MIMFGKYLDEKLKRLGGLSAGLGTPSLCSTARRVLMSGDQLSDGNPTFSVQGWKIGFRVLFSGEVAACLMSLESGNGPRSHRDCPFPESFLGLEEK
jgi:hypothetical protein